MASHPINVGSKAWRARAERAICEHFWKVEPPREPESEGVCSKCGEVQMFSNREQMAPRSGWRYRKQES